jgi:uridylate kinase
MKRILYKVSGEALMGNKEYGQDIEMIRNVASDIKSVVEKGIEVCVVVGGGNIFRGIKSAAHGIDRSSGDYIGMLATVMNAISLQGAIESVGIQTRVMSAFPLPNICETYIRRRALRHLEKGRVLIFAAGTGNPFFTTDTGGVLRAIEVGCDILFKGTGVDGVYSDDPRKNPNAKRYDKITYDDVIMQNLKVMDVSSISMAKENNLKIRVFSIKDSTNPLHNVIFGEGIFTEIS